MYIKQKLLLGLCLFLAVFSIINLLPKKAFADVAATDIRTATYTFRDGSIIIGDFGSSGKVTFVDSNVSDSTRNFTPPDGLFCDPGTIPSQNGVSGDIKFGINISSSANLTDRNIDAQIKLGYTSGTVCHGILQNHIINNPSAAAATDFKWSGTTIVSLEGQNNSDTFLLGENIKAPYSNRLYISQNDGACGANGAILLDSAGGNSGNYWPLQDVTRGNPPNLNDGTNGNLVQTGAFDATTCHVNESGKKRVTIAGSKGTAIDTNAQTDSGKACEDNVASALGWIICPVVEAGEGFAKAIYGQVMDLLSFRVPDDIQSRNGQNNVREAWSIFRTIVTVVVVILMLVMVFSQAIGTGPFEAYTVRKMLPRIAIGVILIQLSWPLLAFVINMVDDLGSGLAQLIYAPFGGSSKLQLIVILQKYGLGSEAFLFSWGVVIGGIISAAVAPFLVLSVIFSVVVAVLVALATLIFRQIIIILCLVTAPIAILLWMVPSPGVQKYWHQWLDNFIKVLLMYPLIVLLIAAGQIFAFVAGGQNPGLINFIIVIVGFFGPLLLLPKAYTWGGQLMRQSGDLINKGASKLSEVPKKELNAQRDAWRAQRQSESGQRWSSGNQKFLRGDYFRAGQWTKFVPGKSADAIRNRQLATLRAQGAHLEGEAERQQEEQERAVLEQRVAFEKQLSTDPTLRGNDANSFNEAIALGELGKTFKLANGQTKTITEEDLAVESQVAAWKRLETLGGQTSMRKLERARYNAITSGNEKLMTSWNKFQDQNAQSLYPKMSHWYKPVSSIAKSDMKPERFTTSSASFMESIIGQLQDGMKSADASVRRDSSEGLASLIAEFNSAINDDNIKGRIDKGSAVVMKALIDGTGMAGINSNRVEPGNPHIEGEVYDMVHNVPTPMGNNMLSSIDPAFRASLEPQLKAISARIRSDGGIS